LAKADHDARVSSEIPHRPPTSTLAVTPRTTLRRERERGNHERDVINTILDEALVAHVGFLADGRPVVLPMAFARVGEQLYLHGAAANHMLRSIADAAVCVTVTLIDALVLARSAFHHSTNYRSVVLFGTATVVSDVAEKQIALDALVDHMVPGRARDARPPTPAELKATLVVRLSIDEGSAKIRTGPPIDDDDDIGLAVWAGEIPLAITAGVPVPDPALAAGIETPAYVTTYARGQTS
jgi:nitroimidazol reductase NimA-like FMN-containing flavoprotein (pyridoxamine 5'-phosphate oxidase superfamily)